MRFAGKHDRVYAKLVELVLPALFDIEYVAPVLAELRTVEIASAIHEYADAGIEPVNQVTAPGVGSKDAPRCRSGR